MKNIVIIAITFFTNFVAAQQTLDTIYANDKKNVALFFPEPIRQGITGTSNFVFTYNREKEQYFGLLQAKSGEESNVLVVTNDGAVYSYILKYAPDLTKLNYFINENESIGNEQPKIQTSIPIEDPKQQLTDKSTYFERYCNYLLKKTKGFVTAKRKKGLVLKLLQKVYHKSEVYLVMEIKNRSGIDFEIDYLNVYVTSGNRRKRSSYQRLPQNPIYRYYVPSIIKNNSSQRLLYVLPKFVLGDDEKLGIELKELSGNRLIIID